MKTYIVCFKVLKGADFDRRFIKLSVNSDYTIDAMKEAEKLFSFENGILELAEYDSVCFNIKMENKYGTGWKKVFKPYKFCEVIKNNYIKYVVKC